MVILRIIMIALKNNFGGLVTAREGAKMNLNWRIPLLAASIPIASFWSHNTCAAENGETHTNLGYLDFLAGFQPPPGFYFRNDVIGVTVGTLIDRNSNPVSLQEFSVNYAVAQQHFGPA
jgi:hypothetical protein